MILVGLTLSLGDFGLMKPLIFFRRSRPSVWRARRNARQLPSLPSPAAAKSEENRIILSQFHVAIYLPTLLTRG